MANSDRRHSNRLSSLRTRDRILRHNTTRRMNRCLEGNLKNVWGQDRSTKYNQLGPFTRLSHNNQENSRSR